MNVKNNPDYRRHLLRHSEEHESLINTERLSNNVYYIREANSLHEEGHQV